MGELNPLAALAAWAVALRAEGDEDTADAIDLQIAAGSCGSLQPAEVSLSRARSQARAAEACSDYALAARHYAIGVQLLSRIGAGCCVESAIEMMNGVARCRLNDGDHLGALAAYTALLKTLTRAYGHEDALAAIARSQVDVCDSALRWGRNTLRLQAHLSTLIQRQAATAVGKSSAARFGHTNQAGGSPCVGT